MSSAEASPFHVGQRRERPFDVNEKNRLISMRLAPELRYLVSIGKVAGSAWDGLQILASGFDSGRGAQSYFSPGTAIRPAPLI